MENPKIRFKGFTKDWEQRKLIDVCDYVDYRGKTPTKTDSGVFLVTAKNVKDGYIDYGVSQEYISEDDYEEVMHRGKPEIGDVLITTEAPCGNVAQVNRADIALAQRIIKYRGQSNIVDNTYLKYYLLSPEFQNILNAKSSGGTVKGIKGSILHQQEIKYPKYEEQFKIGSYFNNLDHLITLHQRKCEQTKKLKKYMLQKMFPQNGAKVPEIRFDGFTYDWEQRKLADVVDSVDTGKSKFDKEGSSGEYPILGSTSVIGYDDEYDYEGDFILTARVGANAGSLYRHTGKVKISDNTVFIQASQNIEFFYQLLIQFDIKKLSFGTGQPLVKASELKSLELMMPTDMKEQMQIGEYFKSLDHLITLHQRKCNELKKMKKYMLQNMFI